MMKYLNTLLLLFVSTFVYAQVDTTLYDHIDNDPRYINLLDEHRDGADRVDSLSNLIAEARERYILARAEFGNSAAVEIAAMQILNMERELMDTRLQQRSIVGDIANLEQRYIVNQKSGAASVIKRGDHSTKIEDVVEHAQLIQNEIFARLLSAGSYADLKEAQKEDLLMPTLVEEYIATYKRIGRSVREYSLATNEQEGDAVYENYLSLRNMADSLGGVIDSYWSNILNAKYYAYNSILERSGRYDLLDSSSVAFKDMQQACAQNDGKYELDALAHYAIGRPTLVAYERDFANEMGLSKAADSLQMVYESIVEPEYCLEPITLEQKSFVEYKPLSFGAKNYYNEANPIPDVKVYSRGIVYRVLLGTFSNSQPASTFKGARPLYVAKGDDGYSYYVAGYASEDEAYEAVVKLAEKGFNNPQVCCWTDGEFKNLSEEALESEVVEVEVPQQPSNCRYVVLMECRSISESLSSTISNEAPDKRISRRGSGFSIGTFSVRQEADALLKVLSEKFPDIKMSILELNIQ